MFPRLGISVLKSVRVFDPVLFMAMMPLTVPSPPNSGISLSSMRIWRRKLNSLALGGEANAYLVKLGTMAISTSLGVLMNPSLVPEGSASLASCLQVGSLSIHYDE